MYGWVVYVLFPECKRINKTVTFLSKIMIISFSISLYICIFIYTIVLYPSNLLALIFQKNLSKTIMKQINLTSFTHNLYINT